MLCTLPFLVLLSYCSGVSSQPTLTQPVSQSVSVGQTAKLTCTVSSNTNTIYWYQQRAGQKPRYVQYAGGSRGEGIPDRFTATASGNVGYLTITNTQAEDEADYYCGMWYSSTYIFGSGTTLSILGQAASPPTVNLFPPSAEERQSKNKATLVCLMDGFIPGAVTVTWQADGTTITNGVETTKPTKVNDKYMAASYLSMDKAEWELREKYSCKVTHAGTEYSKAINRSQCA